MPHVSVQDLHILLLEPSPTQQKIVLSMLHDAGVAHVDAVANGQEALSWIKKQQPDLLISTFYLPDMTATELLHQIRIDANIHQLPFMLVSSETSFRVLDPIRQAGVVAILPKPFALADVQRALRATLHYIDPEELQLDSYDVSALRVLVVDDSPMARKHISRVLRDMGITQITFAENGQDGITKFAASTFDLVVTDYNMPEMDGRQLVHAIRSRSDGVYIPILMVTSEQDRTRLDIVAQAGVSALCDKPFEPATIRATLLSILSH